MKHKHVEMIKAKADDMDLVLLRKTPTSDVWEVCRNDWMPTDLQDDFFLCLPQHKEVCLHWLNNGETQSLRECGWCDVLDNVKEWVNGHLFMQPLIKTRIKPKKEKRWIAINTKESTVASPLFKTSSGCELWVSQQFGLYEGHPWQFIEIEFEV